MFQKFHGHRLLVKPKQGRGFRKCPFPLFLQLLLSREEPWAWAGLAGHVCGRRGEWAAELGRGREDGQQAGGLVPSCLWA